MPRTDEQILALVYDRSATIARKRRRSRAVAIALTTLAVVGLPLLLLRAGGAPSNDEVRPIASAGSTSAPRRTPRAHERDAPAHSGQPDENGYPPLGVGAPIPSDATPRPGTDAANSCDPLFADPAGDVKDAELDLVRSRVTRAGDTLVFTHDIRDLTDVYSTGERRLWQLWFDLGGKVYFVRASHEDAPTGAQERFDVVRSASSEDPNTGAGTTQTATVTSATGRIDNDTNTIEVVVSISKFNDGERELSDAEGDESPPQLRDGVTLRNIRASTSTSKLGAPRGDAAEADCDYRL